MSVYTAAFYDPSHRYHKEAQRLSTKLVETTVEDGVVRWNSNGRVPPADVVEFFAHLDSSISIAWSRVEREREEAVLLDAYRKANANGPGAEERMEARAALGPGVEVVDVITGRKFTT